MHYQGKDPDIKMAIAEFSAQVIQAVCPSLADRLRQNGRARVKYKQLHRNRPLPPEQVYSDEGQRRKIDRWKRNLRRYRRFYERTRLSTDPPANEIFRKPEGWNQ